MKKNLGKALLALSMVAFLGACGGSMEDKEYKDEKYYEANKEEAKDKLKWCFEKAGLGEDAIKLALEEIKNKVLNMKDPVKEMPSYLVYPHFPTDLKNFLYSAKYDIEEKFRTSKDFVELNKVDKSNCKVVLELSFDEEFGKFFKEQSPELLKLGSKKK